MDIQKYVFMCQKTTIANVKIKNIVQSSDSNRSRNVFSLHAWQQEGRVMMSQRCGGPSVVSYQQYYPAFLLGIISNSFMPTY